MNNSVSTKYYTFDDFVQKKDAEGVGAQLPHLYYTIYEKARVKEKPVILELGTHRGMSTLMFLQAIQEKGGHVYSVDIDEQYSDLVDLDDWTFTHAESTDIAGILQNYPEC